MRQLTLFLSLMFLFVCTLNAGAGENRKILTVEQAKSLLNGIDGQVISVKESEIHGFSQIGMKMQDQIIPLYIDDSGRFLFSGNIIDLKQRKNLTEEHFRQLNPIDLEQIPLDDALTLGRSDAPQQTIVFTDPDCPFCSKLHKVLLEAVSSNSDLAFHIIVTPLKESSYQKAKTILCNQSLEQLEKAFSGTSLDVTECDSGAVDNNIALARTLGIQVTPTLILPNGQFKPGYLHLDDLLKLINDNAVSD